MLLSRLASLFRNTVRKDRVERALDDELRAFVELRTDEYVASGIARDEARRKAILECGGIEQLKESVREVRAGALLEQCLQDIRFGARMLRKNPGFAAVAVFTIALGIGANASIFSVFNSVVLHPLPLPESQRVVSMYQTLHGDLQVFCEGGCDMFGYPEYLEYRDRNQVFSGLAAYTPEIHATLDGDQRDIIGQLTTCNYFDVVGVKPVIGRGFSENECAAIGSGPVVVIADRIWRENFNSDPAIIGKVIRLNRTALTVIGIAAPDFHGTELVPANFWSPVTNHPTLLKRIEDPNLLQTTATWSWLSMLGRLKDGVSLPQARANLDVIAAGIDSRIPNRKSVLTIDTATYFGGPEMHLVVIGIGAVVLIATGLVLLIACANLANLMLARAAARSREVAVRLAVGASRGRLIRQLLTESLMIAILGGALGVAISTWTEEALVKTVVAQIPKGQAPVLNVIPDFRVFLYALALTLLTGFAFGLAPALQASKADVNVAMKQDAGIPEPRRAWMRGTLVGAQVAMCMVLLISAGLLLRGLHHAQTLDPGYDLAHHATVNYDMRSEGYSLSQAANLNRDLATRLRALPGVEGVTPVISAPLSGLHVIGQFGISGQTEKFQSEFNIVGQGFFSSLAIPLVRGREFSEADIKNGGVVILNEAASRQLWPGQDPIGKRVHATIPQDSDLDVIGVAKDVDIAEAGNPHKPYLYMPAVAAQQADIRSMLVRTQGNARDLLESLRSAAKGVDPSMRIDVGTLQGNLANQSADSRIVVVLAAALGGLGLLLAAIGIYGTVSYSVARRVREIGIRMTLGARGSDVLDVILRRAMRPVVIGAVIGMVACAGVAQVLRVMLYGVSPLDVIAYLSVAAFLFTVALLASYLPARRALSIDPLAAIRSE
jgi:predicted permease